jgi:6-phosphogluconolactonase (cycloisomerase 2 family)
MISLSFDPAGKHLYAPNSLPGTISVYPYDPTVGLLPAIIGSPYSAGTSPTIIAFNPSGTFAYVANSNSNNVSGYSVDPVSGSLQPVGGSPFAAGGIYPFSLAVEPSGKFVYTANGTSDTISGFQIDPTSGALTAVTGSPFPGGSFPNIVAVHPSGKFVYASNISHPSALPGGGTTGIVGIAGFSIDPSSGAITPIPGSPFPGGSSPNVIAIHPSGRFIYAADWDGITVNGGAGPADILAYAIDPVSGALSPIKGSPFPARSVSWWIAIAN